MPRKLGLDQLNSVADLDIFLESRKELIKVLNIQMFNNVIGLLNNSLIFFLNYNNLKEERNYSVCPTLDPPPAKLIIDKHHNVTQSKK